MSASFDHFSNAFEAKQTKNHTSEAPAAGGTIVIGNKDGGLIEGATNSNETWLLPSTDGLSPGLHVFISNSGTGVLTIQNQAAATIDTVSGTLGEIKGFIVSRTLAWKCMTGMSAAQVAELTALTTSETGTGRIGVPLLNVSKEDGLQLIKQATTVTGYSQLANKNIVIHIPANSTAEAFAASIPTPADIDVTTQGADAELVLNVTVSKSADADTLTLDAELYALSVEDGAWGSDGYGGAAVAITAALSTLQFAGTADWVAGSAAACDALAFVLTLGGTNDGDVVYIHNIYWSYRKKLVTS